MKRLVDRIVRLDRPLVLNNAIKIPRGAKVIFTEVLGAVAALHGYDGDFESLIKEIIASLKNRSSKDDPLNERNDPDARIRLYILSEIYKKAIKTAATQELDIATFQKVHTQYKNGEFKINPLFADPENRAIAIKNKQKNSNQVKEAKEENSQQQDPLASSEKETFKIYDLILSDYVVFGHYQLVEQYALPEANDQSKDDSFKESILQYIYCYIESTNNLRLQKFNALAITFKSSKETRKSIHASLLKDYYQAKTLAKVILHIGVLATLTFDSSKGGFGFEDKNVLTELSVTPLKLLPDVLPDYIKELSAKNTSFLTYLIVLLNHTESTEPVKLGNHNLIEQKDGSYQLTIIYAGIVCRKFNKENLDKRNEILKIYPGFDVSKELYGLPFNLAQFSIEDKGIKAGVLISEENKEMNIQVIESIRTGKQSETEQQPKEVEVEGEEQQVEQPAQKEEPKQESFLDRRLKRIADVEDRQKQRLDSFKKYYDLIN